MRRMTIRGCTGSKVKVHHPRVEVREDHLHKEHLHNRLKVHLGRDLLEKVLQDLSLKDPHLLAKASLLHKAEQNQRRWILMMTPQTLMLDLHLHLRAKVHPHQRAKDLPAKVPISLHLKGKVHLPTSSKGDS